jgi:deoxyribonuclease I
MHSFASLFKFQLSHVTARFILSLLALSPLVPVAAADSPNPTDCKLESQSCVRSALQRYAREGKQVLGYSGARLALFQKVDVYTNAQGERVVKCVYSSDEFPVGNEIPQNGVNTEHTWPQTYLRRAGTIGEGKSDLYHLFPTEMRINGMRGSYPFKDCHMNRPYEGTLCQGNGFEPPEGHKGVVARAMFYMSVLYGMKIDSSQERTLREWSATHPVELSEVERAEKIHKVQGNRNPFIDHPEWIDLVQDF